MSSSFWIAAPDVALLDGELPPPGLCDRTRQFVRCCFRYFIEPPQTRNCGHKPSIPRPTHCGPRIRTATRRLLAPVGLHICGSCGSLKLEGREACARVAPISQVDVADTGNLHSNVLGCKEPICLNEFLLQMESLPRKIHNGAGASSSQSLGPKV